MNKWFYLPNASKALVTENTSPAPHIYWFQAFDKPTQFHAKYLTAIAKGYLPHIRTVSVQFGREVPKPRLLLWNQHEPFQFGCVNNSYSTTQYNVCNNICMKIPLIPLQSYANMNYMKRPYGLHTSTLVCDRSGWYGMRGVWRSANF